MKTIKDAVIQFNAIWPEGADALLTTSENWIHLDSIIGKIRAAYKYDGAGGYAWDNDSYPCMSAGGWVVLCDQQEFEAEAQRMALESAGYINSAEYVNGLQTERKNNQLNNASNIGSERQGIPGCSKVIIGMQANTTDNAAPFDLGAFKPLTVPANSYLKLVVEPIKIEMPEIVYSMKKEPNNSWFEKGDFPPAGVYCQFLLTDGSNKWVNCFVIGVDDLGFCVCRADMDYFASMSPASFRPVEPIKSDCQKFIESAIDASVIDSGIPVAVVPYLNEVFERMFHAGFKSAEKAK